ncbi:hypothetical protein ISS07_04170 [Candidatus Woesearchaeota archaeon]|nr:hypothetical protein [Candidatus Woesearchaeota archaeon]
MNKFFKKTEIFIDRLIPYVLIILLGVIAAELSFPSWAEHYHLQITLIDGIIIGIFVVDLIFKYRRIRDAYIFFKMYWLEIIAVFPAFIFVRMIEEFVLIANLEEALLLSQEGIEVGERVGSRANRIHYFSRFLRPLARLPRFFKAFRFFERPSLF